MDWFEEYIVPYNISKEICEMTLYSILKTLSEGQVVPSDVDTLPYLKLLQQMRLYNENTLPLIEKGLDGFGFRARDPDKMLYLMAKLRDTPLEVLPKE